jgi:hypothetical protein
MKKIFASAVILCVLAFQSAAAARENIEDYFGVWYISEDQSLGGGNYETELTIQSATEKTVTFDLSFYRLAALEKVVANIEGDAARFIDESYGRIVGSLKFIDETIVVSIEKSNFEYIKPQELVFAHRKSEK